MKKNFYTYFLLFFVGVMTAQKNNPTAQKMVETVSEKILKSKALSMRFVYEMTNEETQINEKITGHFSKKGKKFLLQSGSINVLFEGNRSYMINNSAKEINAMNEEEMNDFFSLEQVLSLYKTAGKNGIYRFEKTKQKNIKKITLQIPKDPDVKKYSFTIDRFKNHLQKVVVHQNSGTKITLQILSLNLQATLSDGLFVFDKDKYILSGYMINE